MTQPPFHTELQCFVESIEYDFELRLGSVHIDAGGCTDMSGAITLFERIDPTVIRIETFSDDKQDTVYVRRESGWVAL